MAKEVKEEKNSKIAALEAAIDHINKQYGAGAVMKLGENTHMTVETISTYGSRGAENRRSSCLH